MTDQKNKNAGAYETARLSMAGETLLIVEFGDQLSLGVNEAVLAFDRLLQSENISGLQESATTGNTVALRFDPLIVPPKRFREQIGALVTSQDWFDQSKILRRMLWRVPICYGGRQGPDLASLAIKLGLSEKQVIAAHLQTVQRVFMVGFAPGFLYTGRLPSFFNIPRLSDIKPRVPAGSVSVALGQSVISSTPHPTGWRVIGRTPFRNFDPAREPAIIIKAGDEIRFYQIDQSLYADLRDKARRGLWQPERTGEGYEHS